MKIANKIKASALSAVLVGTLAFSPLAAAYADVADDAAVIAGAVSGMADSKAQAEADAAGDDAVAPSIETDEDTLRAQWTVTFTGEAMVSDGYDTTQTLQDMQPGDTAEFTINLVNAYDGEVDWYVKNMVADSMEQGKENNTGAAYEYELIDIDEDGTETVLYSNTRIGGDTDATLAAAEASAQQTEPVQPAEPAVASDVQRASRTLKASPTDNVIDPVDTEASEGGLLNVTSNSGMDEYFHLATMAPNSTRTMKLVMGIDGETHTNGYFDTNAGALLQYAAEPVGEGETIVTTEGGETNIINRTITTPERTIRTIGGGLPQTGDMLPGITVICVVLGLLVLICGVLSWVNDRRQMREGGAE